MMFEAMALNLKTSTSNIKLSTSNSKRGCLNATASFLYFGADEGDRTLVPSLGSSYSTTELHPHEHLLNYSTSIPVFCKAFSFILFFGKVLELQQLILEYHGILRP